MNLRRHSISTMVYQHPKYIWLWVLVTTLEDEGYNADSSIEHGSRGVSRSHDVDVSWFPFGIVTLTARRSNVAGVNFVYCSSGINETGLILGSRSEKPVPCGICMQLFIF